jgi:hypothetical protein
MSGVPLAMLMGRALTTSLYGVKPLDGLSYILATVGLAGVAVVDPVTALRRE